MISSRKIYPKTNETELNIYIKALESQGFEFYTPIFLNHEEYWDEETPQVEEACPVCNELADQSFNMTMRHDGRQYLMHHCYSCEAVWIDMEEHDD